MKDISIIVPVWNEAENIPSLVKRISKTCNKANLSYELIFIDDHSTDKTIELLADIQKGYPIFFYTKEGKQGKAFSLYEGFKKASAKILVMIDADLQYPPEVIPEMVAMLHDHVDIVVSERIHEQRSHMRKLLSKSYKFLFGKILFGLHTDVQSGLKVFKREIFEAIKTKPASGWTFDLEVLYKATYLGFKIANYPILFKDRKNGKSKVSIIKTTWEIGSNALLLRTTPLRPVTVLPENSNSMSGAGLTHKGKTYITHTTLHHSQSALITFIRDQQLLVATLVIGTVLGLLIVPIVTLQILIGTLSLIYFMDVIFNLFLTIRTLHGSYELNITAEEIATLIDKTLPTYSILCPLYKEAHVISHFLKSISKIDWPKKQLDVMLLLEEDDNESIQMVKEMTLPPYIRILVVPHSFPKTKPKACNYGLAHAKGEYLVIYDAEDAPDPLQLKKAYLGFQKSGEKVFCLQAKLNYYNPNQNLLTRFFTAEYSLWFDMTLPGLQSIHTSIPLGGTSNHFKTANLRRLQGWDPFNVTEDADLGIRLFKQGYTTAIIDSITLEEANSNWGNWLRQRSRWIKGYMQTYLVHTRNHKDLVQKTGIHALFFHLVVGGKIAFILINPLLWIATIAYFSLYAIVGPTIEQLYPPLVFYMAASSLIFGNFLFLYYYMIGCARKGDWGLIKYILVVPFYWLMISVAGGIALYQLILKPHYWEKTIHGLHLKKEVRKVLPQFPTVLGFPVGGIIFLPRLKESISTFVSEKKFFVSSSILVISTMIVNFLNFVFNAYVGRGLTFEEFGVITLLSSFVYMITLPIGSICATVNYRTAFLDGRFGAIRAQSFWQYVRKHSLIVGGISTAVWLGMTPFLMHFFNVSTIYPFISFAPIVLIGFLVCVDRGYLTGKFLFTSLALAMVVETVLKLVVAIGLIHMNLNQYTFISLPLSWIGTCIIGYYLTHRIKIRKEDDTKKYTEKFPRGFFLATFLSGISSTAFLSLDIVLAKHFLLPNVAGQYALISLVGKMVFFLGSLSTPFILPLVSRNEGNNKDSQRTLGLILLSTIVLSLIGYVVFGLFGYLTLPLLFNKNATAIIPYAGLFSLGMVAFTIAQVFTSYYLAKKLYLVSVATFFMTFIQILLIQFFHDSLQAVIWAMFIAGLANLLIMVGIHFSYTYIRILENNIFDFLGLFSRHKIVPSKQNLNILIFNWRDTKHTWAGGAETYVHELAKRWVADGNHVTVFCGNDGRHQHNEVIEGVQVVRRGGFYTVYVWAFLYYMLRFRNRFDVVIDSENGIPFFTPLYVQEPVFLLIHHVHQEVFRTNLVFPFMQIASYIEAELMPKVYKNSSVLTVSESSKREIIKLKFVTHSDISIVNPGINTAEYEKSVKTKHPSVLYFGRLKSYKNIDVAIKAFKKVIVTCPTARMTIAGSGEHENALKELVHKLNMNDYITFTGKVTNEMKKKLLGENWVVVQPSMVEGWGITVIESNASGTPVIASDVNGLRDSIVHNKTGLLVKVKDVSAFADTMLLLITDKRKRALLSKNAYDWSRTFSWDLSAELFYNVLINYKPENNPTIIQNADNLALQVAHYEK